MRKIIFVVALIASATFLFNRCSTKSSAEGNISFYDVPMVCNADTTIGCGSRLKPLFIESAKEKAIKESWVNRKGTVIAFVWADGKPDADVADKLFAKFGIDYSAIDDAKKVSEMTEGMKGKEKWYEGMEVDSLSLLEAGTIASTSTKVILNAGLITEDEATDIKNDIEEYFKKELVKVRTNDELLNDERKKWLDDSYQIYVNHIGVDRADKVKSYYADYLTKKDADEQQCKKTCCGKKELEKKDECCKKK